MKKVTEYTVVTSISPMELLQKVNRLLVDGWIPQGGIAFTEMPPVQGAEDVDVQFLCHQAMVMYEL